MHGVSLAAKILHRTEFSSIVSCLNESIYCPEQADFYTASLECSLKEALYSLRKSSETYAGLEPAIQQVEQLKGHLFRKLFECVRGCSGKYCDSENEKRKKNEIESYFNVYRFWFTGNSSINHEDIFVIAHGDLWVNNLMWRYDHRNKCDGVKFVDLQTLRYTSPAIDILHFLYTSTEYAVREKYMDQLIDDYVDSLYLTLQKFDVHHDYAPNVETLNRIIRQEVRDRAIYGLGICMWLMPAVTAHPGKVVDLDTITLDDFNGDSEGQKIIAMQTPEYHARMKETVMEFYRKGHLNAMT